MSEVLDKPARRRSFFRFSLLTLLMLITVSVVLLEKPVRKMQGKRKLADAMIKNLSPKQLDWDENLAPWFIDWLPTSWVGEKDRQGIEVVRLTHNYSKPEGELSESQKRSQGWADKDRNVMNLLIKYPDASEDVRAIELYHPMTAEMERWIVTRQKLQVLEVRNAEPFRDEFIHGLAKLRSLEVLVLSNATTEQVEILKTMKALKWLTVSVPDKETLESLREALPNTYVN